MNHALNPAGRTARLAQLWGGKIHSRVARQHRDRMPKRRYSSKGVIDPQRSELPREFFGETDMTDEQKPLTSRFVRFHPQGQGYLIDAYECEQAPEHVLEFTIYKAFQHPDVGDRKDGEVYITGSVKWDGCSNWDFHTDKLMLHMCGPDEANELAWLLKQCYAIGIELMNWTEYEMEGV